MVKTLNEKTIQLQNYTLPHPQATGRQFGKMRSGRIVYNLSVIGEDPTAKNLQGDALIQYHASLRVQLIYQSLVVYWKKAVRTDGTTREFEVSVGRARVQVDQSHKEGYHAAHSFPASGLIDNIWNCMMREISSEGVATPQKIKILEALRRAHEKLQNEVIDKENIVSDLNHGVKRSLFSDTPAELALNRTNVLGRRVNLRTDRGLEANVREELIPKIIRLSAKGEVEPHLLTKQFVEESRNHFRQAIAQCDSAIKDLEMKSLDVKGLNSDDRNRLKKLKLDLKSNQWQLDGTVEPKYEQLIGKTDPVTNKKVMLTGDELFQASLKLLSRFNPKQ